MPNHLDKIDHLVVLMLENRSFDSVAGYLYDPGNAPPFDQVPRGQPFEGLSGKALANPFPGGGAASIRHAGKLTGPDPDPGEEFEHINVQLYGTNPAPRPLPAVAPMDGFVTDYANVIHDYNLKHPLRPTRADPASIMEYFTPADLPVLSRLANQYAVCDEWFCSVPSQTWPNRSFVHAATSSGRVNNCNPGSSIPVPNNTPTIFNALQEKGLGWRIYYDSESVLPLSLLAQDQLVPYFNSNCSFMNRFWTDAAAPNGLPAYSFIEPRFLLDHNDQHPGGLLTESMTNGERLIGQVYEAIRNGPNWEDTLLVITYDEHGGCYDHVPPPLGATPPDPARPAGENGFLFDRYGVRVCTVLVSPLVEPGTVFRAGSAVGPGSRPLDHTSIIKTIALRWGLDPLTDRDAKAADIGDALTVWPPRTDGPVSVTPPLAAARAALPPLLQPSSEIPSEFQQQFAAAVTARLVPFKGAVIAPPQHRSVAEVADFLKERLRAFPRPH